MDIIAYAALWNSEEVVSMNFLTLIKNLKCCRRIISVSVAISYKVADIRNIF